MYSASAAPDDRGHMDAHGGLLGAHAGQEALRRPDRSTLETLIYLRFSATVSVWRLLPLCILRGSVVG